MFVPVPTFLLFLLLSAVRVCALSWFVGPLQQVSKNPRSLFLTSSYAWNYITSFNPLPPSHSKQTMMSSQCDSATCGIQRSPTQSLTRKRFSPSSFPHVQENAREKSAQCCSETKDKSISSPQTWYHFPLSLTGSKHQQEQRDDLKRRLFAMCAGCDRGFAAVPVDRQEIDQLIRQLHELNPCTNATRNFYPRVFSKDANTPLEGAWKMIYTSAYDVCALASNPLTIVQGVYQLISRDGSATHVIDVAPRPQALLPPSLIGEGTTLRFKVHVRASAENDNQIGLNYRRVEMKPLKIFNFDVYSFVPAISAPLPSLILQEGRLLFNKQKRFWSRKPNVSQIEEPLPDILTYYDIVYLDDDTLIIKHSNLNEYFVSVRSTEPSTFF